MASYRITSPDGKSWDVTAPEGASQDQVLEYAKSQWGKSQPAQAAQQPVPPQQGDSLARQAGLFARSSMAGLAGVPQIVTEPLRQMIVDPFARAMGGSNSRSLVDMAGGLADSMGLPTPRAGMESIVGKGVEMGMGSAGMAGLAGKIGGLVQSGAAKEVASSMGANMGTQAASGAAGGMAGQQAKENGGGAFNQFASTVLGGLGGAGVMAAGKGIANAASNLMRPGLAPAAIDQHITQILINQGIDPASIGPAMLSKMREDVGKAMKVGGNLDENAVGRLADYSRVGATPTRAGVTLDPYDVTLQRNAEKMAAAMGDRGAKLPQITSDNDRLLTGLVNSMGPSADAYGNGSQIIASITAKNAAMTAEKKGLYDAARNMAGGDIPVDRGAFTNAAFEGLIKQNKLAFLPENISSLLNQISKGVVSMNGKDHPVPFTVDTIDMLKTMIATESRGTANGNAKAALSIVRDALENVPINPVKRGFGGSQLVTGGGAAGLQGADAQASNLLGALDKARASARGQFAWQESAPGIEAALGGTVPQEAFIKRLIISSAAGADNVAKLAADMGPADLAAVKSSIVQHLLESATQKGRDAASSNFNGPGLSSAIKTMGDKKLGLFFTPDEIETLKSAGRVGGFETMQPRGSAVNNSNSAAAIAGILQSISSKAKMLPVIGPMTVPALDALSLGAVTRPAMNISGGLLSEVPKKGAFAKGLLAPALYGSGLLLAP
jgi:hypothetical protein